MDVFGHIRRACGVAALAGMALLAGCERPPVDTSQNGYRGTAMAQIQNPRSVAADAALHAMPEIAPAARVRANAPKAGAVYQNVKVLGDVSIAEFGRTMDAMTAWVSPKESCTYCHVEGNFADDGKYTKIVARRMLQMTQHLNADWKAHVGDTGVTCYTCHRGQPIPANVWFKPLEPTDGRLFIGNKDGQNTPVRSVALTSLPSDPFSAYLASEESAKSIRVAGTSALPQGPGSDVKQTESSYGLMIHMSKALGVNCTFCHNTQSFSSWPASTPQRVTAWHGIRLARDLNSNYLSPLSGTFPEVPVGRLGPTGDAAKVNCSTCHQGVNKPLLGAQMARHYPALLGPAALAAAAAASAPEPAEAQKN